MRANDIQNTQITVRYSAIDGAKQTKKFSNVNAARAFAVDRVGAGAEVSRSGYAVSNDGIGKITVEGISIQELMSGEKASRVTGTFGVMRFYNCESHNGSRLVGQYDTREDQMQALCHFQETDHSECYHLAVDLVNGQWVKVLPLYNGKTADEIVAETYGCGRKP